MREGLSDLDCLNQLSMQKNMLTLLTKTGNRFTCFECENSKFRMSLYNQGIQQIDRRAEISAVYV